MQEQLFKLLFGNYSTVHKSLVGAGLVIDIEPQQSYYDARSLIRRLERATSPDSILVVNPANLDLDRIAEVATHPERVIGILFPDASFSMNPRINIVVGSATSDEVVERTIKIAERIGRLSAIIKEGKETEWQQRQYVTMEVNGRIADIAIESAQINPMFMEQLGDAVAQANQRDDVNSIVLRINMPETDLNFYRLQMLHDQIEEIITFVKDGLAVSRGIQFSRKPVIAKIEGEANGIGFELAEHAAIVLMTEGATAQLPETGLGIFPVLRGTHLPLQRMETILKIRLSAGGMSEAEAQKEARRLARSRTKQIILANPILTGEMAFNLGLIDLPSDATEDFEQALRAQEGEIDAALRKTLALPKYHNRKAEISTLQEMLDWAFDADAVFEIERNLQALLSGESPFSKPESENTKTIESYLRAVGSHDYQYALATANEIVNSAKFGDGTKRALTELPRVFKTIESKRGILSRDPDVTIGVSSSPASDKIGGIDLNANGLDLQTSNVGTFSFPVPTPQMIQDMNQATGLVPTIIQVTPIANLSLILGLVDEDEAQPFANYKNESLDEARNEYFDRLFAHS